VTRTTTALLVAAASLAALGLAPRPPEPSRSPPPGRSCSPTSQLDAVTAGGTRTASSSGSLESTLVDPDDSGTGSVEFGGYQTDQVTIRGSKRLTTSESS
jgi:hypothetical protein